MPPPVQLPVWATSGTTTPEPSAQRQATGWEFRQSPPFNFFNWWMNRVYQWILHFSRSCARFDTLEDAVAGLTPGQTGIVHEYDLDQAPGTVNVPVDTGANVISLDVSGTAVVYAEVGAGNIVSVSRADLTTVLATYVKSNVGANLIVRTDGRRTVLAYGNFVELFDAVTGASLWDYDHGAAVSDVCMDGVNVYYVGNTSGGIEARALSMATGASVWAYAHGANLNTCACNGNQVFIAGSASPSPSGATIRALQALNGRDAANEGGTGPCLTGVAWDDVQPVVQASGELLATDGRFLYCAYSAAAPAQVEVRGCYDGEIVVSKALPSTLSSICVDHEFVFCCSTTTFQTWALDKRTLAMAWQWLHTADIFSAATDGAAAFAASTTASGISLARLFRGNRATLWQRVDPADRHLPYRQLILPYQ